MVSGNYEPTSPPRVRFAPSPTGDLHIGSARTALFNYLFARHYNGKFILRIEDTDQVRSTEESLANLVEGLTWLGIRWDEGPDEERPTDLSKERGDFRPYLQSARRARHHEAAKLLKDAGHAYECICPPQETAGSSSCKCIEKQNEIFPLPMEQKSLKFRIPPGPPVVVKDLIRGEVVFRRDDLQDFIILRADGSPTYNFVVVIDDAAMEITHVIRGDDHLSNTPKQILIYEALGYRIPEFAHIPLIHGSDGTRMSKRHGAVSVMAYKNEGFLTSAFVNYLAHLGWNNDTDREIYSLTELEEEFRLYQVSSSPAAFDRDKLMWFNGKYIRMLGDEDFFNACLPFLADHVNSSDLTENTRTRLIGMLSMFKERIETLAQIADATGYFFVDIEEYSEEDLAEAKVTGDVFIALAELKKILTETDWTKETLEKAIRQYVKSKGVGLGKVVHPLRLVVTGRLATPGIFETLFYIGKDATLRRLEFFLSNYRPPN